MKAQKEPEMHDEDLPTADSEGQDKTYLHKPRGTGLPSLWSAARRELDSSRVTRILRSGDLPDFRTSEHERRGDMGKARIWRIEFFRRSVADLLALALDRGLVPTTAKFWEADFPRWWFDSANHHKALPLLAPSLKRPAEALYAKSDEYRDFANGAFRDRIRARLPYLVPYLPRTRYDPDDRSSFQDHALLLSAASVILTAQRLDLCGNQADDVEDILGARWLDATDGDPLNFRFRSKVWPDLRYNYVDLLLRPILAQALSYEEEDWDAPWLERNLPLTEAAARTRGGMVEHTGLRRSDIEMAVWCEALSRMLETGVSHDPAGAMSKLVCLDAMSPFEGLPRRLRLLAEKLREVSHKLADRSSTGSRFVPPEVASLSGLRELLGRPAWHLGDAVQQIPTGLATPVLEDGRLCINLDWELVAPDAEWMSVHILVLVECEGNTVCEILDFEEIEPDEDSGSLLCIDLRGPTWERLRQQVAMTELEAAFLDTVIACQGQGNGNGSTVVGLVDLTKHG